MNRAKALAPLPLALLSLAAAPGRHVSLDGARVHYESYGRGREAVVFIHGWTCDLTFWRAQAPLRERRRVLLIDLPGHGRSDKPEVAYTQELFARAVDAVMRDAGVEKAALVGHSMGGPVALTFLQRFPGKTTALVLADVFMPRPPKDDAERQAGAARAAQMLQAYRGPDYRKALGQMLDFMFTPQSPAALREEIRAKMTATPQHVVASAMEGMLALTPLREVRFDVPALAVMAPQLGRQPGYEDFLRAIFPKLEYRVMDEVGHFLMLEKPDEFNRLVAGFLSGLRTQ